MGKIYHLDITDTCIDPQTVLSDILHNIGEDVTLHTSKESLQRFAQHPLLYGRLAGDFGEVVTWYDLEQYTGVGFKYHSVWTGNVFTPYRGDVPTGDLIVLGGVK